MQFSVNKWLKIIMSSLNTIVYLCKEVFDENSQPTQIGNVLMYMVYTIYYIIYKILKYRC